MITPVIDTETIVVVILWFMFWVYMSAKLENDYNITPLIHFILGGIVLPLLVFGF